MKPSVLLIGQAAATEFAAACAELRGAALVWQREEAGFQGEPDLIVVCERRVGEFTETDIDRLRLQFPLARVIRLLGTWCEGEGRSGRPWPADERLYWHQAAGRLRQELVRAAAGQLAIWGQPQTLTDLERTAAGNRELPRGQGLVVIRARHRDLGELWQAACENWGYATLLCEGAAPPRVTGAVAGIWDHHRCEGQAVAELAAVVDWLQPAPVLAMLDFPREHDVQAALAAGAERVLSKPLRMVELAAELQDAVAAFRRASAAA